jgi:hypothetical protein
MDPEESLSCSQGPAPGHYPEPDACYACHFHHAMVRPRVADGGDGLKIWRVATRTLNKQPKTVDKEWYSSLGLRG